MHMTGSSLERCLLHTCICILPAGGERILTVFETRLTASIRALNFTKLLESENVKRVVEEADGYQPHLVAPEMGYRRLLQECLVLFKVPPRPTSRPATCGQQY